MTNRDQLDSDWSDERLDAAFRRQFDVAPPATLDAKVHGALVEANVGPRPGVMWRGSRWTGRTVAQLTVAAAILVVVLGSLASRDGRPIPTGNGQPGHSAAGSPALPGTSAAALPAPSRLVVPGSKDPQPVLSVAQAIEHRAKDPAGAEIVVGGWFTFHPVPCGVLPDASSELENCGVGFTWLMDAPEELADLAPDGSGSIHAPVGPGINLVLAYTQWRPPFEERPIPIAVAGHFKDQRAGACPAGGRRDRCEALFVVDAPLWTSAGTIDVAHAPTEAFGLPVVGIDEAIAVRDSGSSDEIAVAGWYNEPDLMSCPASMATGTTWLYGLCEGGFQWLMAEPEALISKTPDSLEMHGPSGPAIQVAFPTIQRPLGNALPNVGSPVPAPAVFVGHFNDRRSRDCAFESNDDPADIQAGCRSRFVVDAVGWVSGETRYALVSDRRDPTSAQLDVAPDVAAIVARAVDGGISVDHTVIVGPELASLEPSIAKEYPELSAASSLWLETVLVPRTVCTPLSCALDPQRWTAIVLVIDKAGQIWGQLGPKVVFVRQDATFPIEDLP